MKTKIYDFKLEEDQNDILSYYGGREFMKKNYPLMYEAFDNACHHQVIKSEERPTYTSLAQTHYLYYDEQQQIYKSAGNVVLTEKTDILQCIMEIFKNGKRIAADTKLYNNTQYCYMSLNSPVNMHHYGEDTYVKVTAIWKNKKNMLEVCSSFETLALGDYEYIEKYTNIHPQKQISQYPEQIRVSYARTPTSPTYDYVYPESRTVDKYEKVSLNMEGEVKLKDGWKFSRIDSYKASMWRLDSGVIVYSGNEPEISITENGFHYKFPVEKDAKGNEYCKWEDYIPDSVQYGNQLYEFEMKLKFYITDGENEETQIVETSTLDVENPPINLSFIPQIRLFWGCIAAESLVLMEDCVLKKIDKINKGDRVRINGNEIADVKNVIVGQEKEILHIETESGKIIEVCPHHPLLTLNGYTPACKLTGQDVLVGIDGNEYIKYAYMKEYNKNVYSLSLSNNCNGYIANGIIVGSYEMENSITLKNEQNVEVKKELLEESERIRKNFQYIL